MPPENQLQYQDQDLIPPKSKNTLIWAVVLVVVLLISVLVSVYFVVWERTDVIEPEITTEETTEEEKVVVTEPEEPKTPVEDTVTQPQFHRWVNLEVEAQESISAVSFDIEFLSDKSTEGLFTLYFNDEKIGYADQKYQLSQFFQHVFHSDPATGKSIISFRLDAWGEGVAKAKISNIKLGWMDMEVWNKAQEAEMVFKDINEFFTGKVFSDFGESSFDSIKELYFEAEPQS